MFTDNLILLTAGTAWLPSSNVQYEVHRRIAHAQSAPEKKKSVDGRDNEGLTRTAARENNRGF